jgi:serine/threonine protein kinase
MNPSSGKDSDDIDSKPPTVFAPDEATGTFGRNTLDRARETTFSEPKSDETASIPPLGAQIANKVETSAASTVCGYEILDVLGRGAMGIVYKARQPGLKRIVALKMILSGDLAGTHERLRFRSEAEVIARLQHPNIVQIFEIGEDSDRPFFSMEFVEGTSLSKSIAATPQPPREAARIVQTLAAAIQSAHSKNIIHRDIKPANILIAVDGTPKITDFGLAKSLEEHSGQTHSGTILGTPSYMSPEQAEGRVLDITPRSDIYSLGAVLYELLTGRAPFKAGSVLDTLQQVKTMEPVAPIQFAPTVPRDLETICLKCLQKDPARRYESAQALADDLGRFLAGEPILARPVSVPERLWRWCRRNPRIAVLSGSIAAVVLAWASTTTILAISIKQQKDNADKARAEALTNAEKAEHNAQIAIANEATAEANAELANKHALTAKREHQLLIGRMLTFGENLQKRLNTRRMGSGPEMIRARDDLLQLLRETVVTLGKDLEGTDVSQFATASAYQQIGDLLVRLGQGREALVQFRKAYDAVKYVADRQPDNDVARANLASILDRLGTISLDLLGDPKEALKLHRQAFDLLQEVVEHPRSGFYTEADNKRLPAFTLMHLGKTHLATGELHEAARCFEDALKLREAWLKLIPKATSIESFICETHMWLGVTAGRLGDTKKTSLEFGKCVENCESLASRFPKNISYKSDLAQIYGFLGDTQKQFGQLDEASKSYQKSKENLLIVLNNDVDDLSRQALQALTLERLGMFAVTQHKSEDAAKRFQDALKIRNDMSQVEPDNQTWRAAYGLALARVGQTAEASKVADQFGSSCPNSATMQFQAARTYAICSSKEETTDKKRAFADKALIAMRSAIAAGWKDPLLFETDPELTPLREAPGYKELLNSIEKPPLKP